LKLIRSSIILLAFSSFQTLSPTSIWIAEGMPYAKEARECYVPLQMNSQVSQLSRTVAEFADKEINENATDSTNARIASLLCLRKYLKSEEDRKALADSYEISMFSEDHLHLIEKKILLKKDREYYLTPMEERSATDYYLLRESLAADIRKLTLSAILMEEKEWKEEGKNWREETKARYGALLREREKFLFSLSIETRASYLTFLRQFTEK